MPRWRQVINEQGKSEFVPIGNTAASGTGAAVHGDIESFVSPIDGTVIRDRKQYREHCKKHNVVPASDFTPEYYARKAKERADYFNGKVAREESFRRKQQIHEIMMRAERNGK